MSQRKKAIITGSNKGIGYALAKQLIKNNYDVWVGARDVELGQAAAKELGANFLRMDVTKTESLKEALRTYSLQNSSLDLLINNAGVALYGQDGPPSSASVPAMRDTFAVNFFGALDVTQVFLPLLRKTSNSQILNITSALGSLSMLSEPAGPLDNIPLGIGYSASKASLNTLTILLAKELRPNGIRVNSVCPGSVSTDMNSAGQLTPDETAKNIVSLILNDDFGTGKFGQVNGFYPW
jgi:NAD(P)-dependent dehydrogenase (short-subunit alcohol dehydrogenase family)